MPRSEVKIAHILRIKGLRTGGFADDGGEKLPAHQTRREVSKVRTEAFFRENAMALSPAEVNSIWEKCM